MSLTGEVATFKRSLPCCSLREITRRAYRNFRWSKSGRKLVARAYPFRPIVFKVVQKWQVRRKGKPVPLIFNHFSTGENSGMPVVRERGGPTYPRAVDVWEWEWETGWRTRCRSSSKRSSTFAICQSRSRARLGTEQRLCCPSGARRVRARVFVLNGIMMGSGCSPEWGVRSAAYQAMGSRWRPFRAGQP